MGSLAPAKMVLVVAMVSRAVFFAWMRETAYLTAALALCMGILYSVHRKVFLAGYATGMAARPATALIRFTPRVIRVDGNPAWVMMECQSR